MILNVPRRNWQSPGARIAGIRRVDAHNHGPVTVRSVILEEFAGAAFGFVTTPLTSGLRRRSEAEQARLAALTPQIKALRREHSGDPDTQKRAMTEFYRANDVNPLNSMAWLLPGTLLMPLTALFSRRRQTLSQRMAGTLVITTR